jgi:hypothetical protein
VCVGGGVRIPACKGIREWRQGLEVFLTTVLAVFFSFGLSAIRIVIHPILIVILAIIIILRFQLSRSLILSKCISCIFQL